METTCPACSELVTIQALEYPFVLRTEEKCLSCGHNIVMNKFIDCRATSATGGRDE